VIRRNGEPRRIAELPQDKAAKDLPPPATIAGVGHSHFAITTASPQAQVWFDQGLALLHCFWDFEALRAFRGAARLDPDCAMCQWGIYRAMDFAGSAADQLKPVVTKMKELAPGASEHEQRYIRSVVESFGKRQSTTRWTLESGGRRWRRAGERATGQGQAKACPTLPC